MQIPGFRRPIDVIRLDRESKARVVNVNYSMKIDNFCKRERERERERSVEIW